MDASVTIGPARWGDRVGRELRLTARLDDDRGEPVPGLVPATVTVRQPDGVRGDFSCHTVFRRGVLRYSFPVLCNGPVGTWRLAVLERATGRTAALTVDVGPAH
jgi:uncharacterized protein YfaS (alpha-2-macroglobulin family)